MIDSIDRRANQRIVAALLRSPQASTLLPALQRVSQTGSYGVGWIVLFAIVVTVSHGLMVAAVAAGSVWAALAVNTAIKLLVRRQRPAQCIGDAPSTYSFPSAHTTMAVVGAAVMTSLLPLLAPLWWAWTLILAASRVLIGAHYPSDVLAGGLLGGALAIGIVVPLIERVS